MSSEWVEKRLGDLGKTQTGTTPKTSQSDNFGNFIPFITPADFYTDGHINVNNKGLSEKGLNGSRLIDDGSVLMVCIGATIGKCGFNEKAVAANQQINALTPDSSVSPKFLYYQMLTPLFQKAVLYSSGQATLPIINKTKWSNLLVSIPSFSEQKRIVAILDEAFAGISQAVANAEKNLANARELFESYLNNIFTQKGEGWEEKPLIEITSILGDGLHGTPEYTEDGEYFFINGNNLNNGVIKFKERTKKVSVDEYLKYKKYLTDRTILVSINGTLGNVAFYNGEKIILGKSACYFNLLENVDKNFVKYVISSPYFFKYAHKEATGATIKNVSLKTMRAFKVPLPPLKEQRAIVKKLGALSSKTIKLETIYQKKLSALTELKQSILQKAFTGELTTGTALPQVNG